MSRPALHGWILMGMLVVTVLVALAIPAGIYLTRRALLYRRGVRSIGAR